MDIKNEKRKTMKNNTIYDELVKKLVRAGATEPEDWAKSEVSENIPQFARFLVLKNLFQIAQDVESSLLCANDFSDMDSQVEEMKGKVGEDTLMDFLQNYSFGLISQVMDVLDSGNPELEEDGVSWILSETNGDGALTERFIEGLHEDALDFMEQVAYGEV